MQWNSSNPDTNGTEESVHISEVSLFQGEKKSLLKRCPHFKNVLGEVVYCFDLVFLNS